jgi:hypothetical protein
MEVNGLVFYAVEDKIPQITHIKRHIRICRDHTEIAGYQNQGVLDSLGKADLRCQRCDCPFSDAALIQQ